MKKLLSLVALLVPSVAFAQSQPIQTITNINGVSSVLNGIGNTVIYLLTALAVIFIIWNVVMYLIKGSGEEGRGKAAANIGWGILGLAIILSLWGLVNIITGTFRTNPVSQQVNPTLGNQPPVVQ